MKNLIIFIGILFVLYLIGFLFDENRIDSKYECMSFQHSNAYRGIAALIIMFQHVAGKYGVRYLTPLGGTGVAIFLISSGYGLNESYKRRGIGGGIGFLRLLGC